MLSTTRGWQPCEHAGDEAGSSPSQKGTHLLLSWKKSSSGMVVPK